MPEPHSVHGNLKEFTPQNVQEGIQKGSGQSSIGETVLFGVFLILLLALFGGLLIVDELYCSNQLCPELAPRPTPPEERFAFDDTLTVPFTSDTVVPIRATTIEDVSQTQEVPQSVTVEPVTNENCYESSFAEETVNHPVALSSMDNFPSHIHLMEEMEKPQRVYVSFVTHMCFCLFYPEE